jgi:hypothetical protein
MSVLFLSRANRFKIDLREEGLESMSCIHLAQCMEEGRSLVYRVIHFGF